MVAWRYNSVLTIYKQCKDDLWEVLSKLEILDYNNTATNKLNLAGSLSKRKK